MAKAKSKTLGCLGYQLQVKNDADNFRLALTLTGDDGKTYTMQVLAIHDRPGLVAELFQTVRTVWPSFAFFFTVDADDDITGFSPTKGPG